MNDYEQHLQQRPQQHARSRSGFSFSSNKSNKSDKSSGSKPKITNLHETQADKEARRFREALKTNPNVAINEAQPIIRAQEASTLANIRGGQHKDIHGNLIVDPDASNPTRPRMERPLDTIRGFHAAIDSSYKRRDQVQRTESADGHSSHVGHSTHHRYTPSAPYDNRHARQPNYDQHHGHGYPNYMQRQRPARSHGPQLSHTQSDYGVYPNHTYHDSNDTFQTGYSSGSQSEQWANSTDPTSDSGSLDRSQPYRNGDGHDAYGEHWKGSPIEAPIMEESGAHHYQGYNPPGPSPGVQRQRQPIRLGNNNGPGPGAHPPPPPPQHNYNMPPQQQQQQQQQQAYPESNTQKPLPNIQQQGQGYYPPRQQGPAPGHGSQPSYDQNAYRPAPNARTGPPPASGGRLQKVNSGGDEKRKSWLRRRFSRS